MLEAKPLSFLTGFIITATTVLVLISCSVVPKNYPANKPFVFETNINVEGNLSKEERDVLASQLRTQLDDSMRAKTVYKLIYKGINRQVLMNPPVFDSASAERSMSFMKALLNKQGYLRDSIYYDTTMRIIADSKPPELRTTVTFHVFPNQLFTIDSISHVINNDELQALTDASKQNTILKKGQPFAQQLISEELNRLVVLYRDNGYLKFSFDELAAVWDTLNLAILRPSVDPFDIAFLEELKRRRDFPTTDIEIRLRPGHDIEKLKKYFVGHTTIYPDFSVVDTVGKVPVRFVYDNNFTFVSYQNLFKRKFIAQNIFFKRGDLYNQRRFLKTINRLNDIGAWRVVNIEPKPRDPTDTVDFNVYLTPEKKIALTGSIEGSFNNSNSIILQENLLGVGASATILNRNFRRAGNRSSTIARYSTEVDLKGQFVKTRQASISHTILFPKPIPNAKWIPEGLRDNFKTALTFSLANTVRNDFFDLTSLNASWGYNFQWRNKSAYLKLPNIEFARIKKEIGLDTIIRNNPTLKNVFPDNGLVLSIQAGFSIRRAVKNSSQIFRVNIEESGLLASNFNLNIFDSLFKFVKVDAEFIRNTQFGKNSLIVRGYIGAGFAMKTKDRPNNPSMPFFKQFTAGGPYSMRAWGIRLLGPGSASKTKEEAPIRFGDFQFETNVEYRFPLAKLFGYKVASCLFTDIGNVWFLRENADFPNGNLTGKSFFRDLAVGVGTGLRFDFEFLKVRLDYGIKAKDPTKAPDNNAGQNKWFYNFPKDGIIQIGINYPFTF